MWCDKHSTASVLPGYLEETKASPFRVQGASEGQEGEARPEGWAEGRGGSGGGGGGRQASGQMEKKP